MEYCINERKSHYTVENQKSFNVIFFGWEGTCFVADLWDYVSSPMSFVANTVFVLICFVHVPKVTEQQHKLTAQVSSTS